MEKQPEVRRFYQGKQLVTQVQGPDFSQTLLFAGGRCLGKRQGAGSSIDPGLIATDFKGSVIDVIHGNDVSRHTYTPYGYGPAVSAMFPSPGFNGALLELVTGCYMLGNGTRGYDPRVMRFTSPDRLSPFLKGGINSYAYCEGDPVNYLDPTGKVKTTALGLSRKSVAIAKKRQSRAGWRDFEKKLAASRDHLMLVYDEAPDLLQGLAVSKLSKHNQIFQKFKDVPSVDPLRREAFQDFARDLGGLFTFSDDAQVRSRRQVVIAAIFQAGKLSSEEKLSFARMTTLASNHALRANAYVRNHRRVLATAAPSAHGMVNLTPPQSPISLP